jgi:thiol-disulfide isomerase/thioredoxin
MNLKKILFLGKARQAARVVLFAAALIFFAAPVLSAAPQDKTIPAEIKNAFAKAGLPVLREKTDIIDFVLPLLDGTNVRLSEYKGKTVFLNFWATWCPPCRAEMPSMEILYQRFRGKGLEFLAVDIQESNKDVADFMKEYKLTFPMALDSTGKVSGNYGIQGIPTTFIIDRDGKIIAAAVGGRNWDTEVMFAAFETLLK